MDNQARASYCDMASVMDPYYSLAPLGRADHQANPCRAFHAIPPRDTEYGYGSSPLVTNKGHPPVPYGREREPHSPFPAECQPLDSGGGARGAEGSLGKYRPYTHEAQPCSTPPEGSRLHAGSPLNNEGLDSSYGGESGCFFSISVIFVFPGQ